MKGFPNYHIVYLEPINETGFPRAKIIQEGYDDQYYTETEIQNLLSSPTIDEARAYVLEVALAMFDRSAGLLETESD